MDRVTLKFQNDGTYASSNGRWSVVPDPARNDPDAWILTDNTRRERPAFNLSLAAIRRYLNR